MLFVDGCDFHSCPACGFSGPKSNPGRDATITQALQALGYTVLRIWEHELSDPHSDWAQRLAAALK